MEVRKINDKQKMIDIYKKYGYDMPLNARYKRDKNRVYFCNDFKDGEEITFFWNCAKPNACASGSAFYTGKNSISNLVNISELEPIE